MKLLIVAMLMCLTAGAKANIPESVDMHGIIMPELGVRLAKRDLQICDTRAQLGYAVSAFAHKIPMKAQLADLSYAIFSAPRERYATAEIAHLRNIIITAYSKAARIDPIRYANFLYSDCLTEKKIYSASK